MLFAFAVSSRFCHNVTEKLAVDDSIGGRTEKAIELFLGFVLRMRQEFDASWFSESEQYSLARFYFRIGWATPVFHRRFRALCAHNLIERGVVSRSERFFRGAPMYTVGIQRISTPRPWNGFASMSILCICFESKFRWILSADRIAVDDSMDPRLHAGSEFKTFCLTSNQ